MSGVAPTNRCPIAEPGSGNGVTPTKWRDANAPPQRCSDETRSCKPHMNPPSPHFIGETHTQTVVVNVRSGSDINMISERMADELACEILVDEMGYEYVTHMDGTPVQDIIGLAEFYVMVNGLPLWFEGVVVTDLDADIVAGIPFMELNDLTVRPAKQLILFGDDSEFRYGVSDVNNSPIHTGHSVVSPVDQDSTSPVLAAHVIESMSDLDPGDVPQSPESVFEPRVFNEKSMMSDLPFQCVPQEPCPGLAVGYTSQVTSSHPIGGFGEPCSQPIKECMSGYGLCTKYHSGVAHAFIADTKTYDSADGGHALHDSAHALSDPDSAYELTNTDSAHAPAVPNSARASADPDGPMRWLILIVRMRQLILMVPMLWLILIVRMRQLIRIVRMRQRILMVPSSWLILIMRMRQLSLIMIM